MHDNILGCLKVIIVEDRDQAEVVDGVYHLDTGKSSHVLPPLALDYFFEIYLAFPIGSTCSAALLPT